MTFKWSPKDPSDVADYLFDWGSTNLDVDKRFLAAGVTISTYTVTVETGLTKVSDALTLSSKGVTFRVSGGTAGHICVPGVNFPTELAGALGYAVTCIINTSDGQTFEATKILPVKERALLTPV